MLIISSMVEATAGWPACASSYSTSGTCQGPDWCELRVGTGRGCASCTHRFGQVEESVLRRRRRGFQLQHLPAGPGRAGLRARIRRGVALVPVVHRAQHLDARALGDSELLEVGSRL